MSSSFSHQHIVFSVLHFDLNMQCTQIRKSRLHFASRFSGTTVATSWTNKPDPSDGSTIQKNLCWRSLHLCSLVVGISPLHLNCLLLPSNAMKFLLSPLTMVLNVNVIKSLTLIRYYYTVTKLVAGPKRSWVKITTWGLSAWSSPGACLGYLQAL